MPKLIRDFPASHVWSEGYTKWGLIWIDPFPQLNCSKAHSQLHHASGSRILGQPKLQRLETWVVSNWGILLVAMLVRNWWAFFPLYIGCFIGWNHWNFPMILQETILPRWNMKCGADVDFINPWNWHLRICHGTYGSLTKIAMDEWRPESWAVGKNDHGTMWDCLKFSNVNIHDKNYVWENYFPSQKCHTVGHQASPVFRKTRTLLWLETIKPFPNCGVLLMFISEFNWQINGCSLTTICHSCCSSPK